MGSRHQFVFCIVVFIVKSATASKFTLGAFDYHRAHGKPLSLGQCPNRTELLDNGEPVLLACNKKILGQTTTDSVVINTTYEMNAIVHSATELFKLIGICDGNAVSRLGLLYSKKDCASVEGENFEVEDTFRYLWDTVYAGGGCDAGTTVDISSALSFEPNVGLYTRVYVYYKQNAMDTIHTTWQPAAEYAHMYREDHYLHDVIYGAIEVIIIQLRYNHRRTFKKAMKVKQESLLMSDWLSGLEELSRDPVKMKYIRYSTAENILDVTSGSYNYCELMDRLLLYEGQIRKIKHVLDTDEYKNYPLTYMFQSFINPYAGGGHASAVKSNTEHAGWMKMSGQEADTRHAILQGKAGMKVCGAKRSKPCRKLRRKIKALTLTMTKLHNGRARWYTLLAEEKEKMIEEFARKIPKNVKSIRKHLCRELKVLEHCSKRKSKKKRQVKP